MDPSTAGYEQVPRNDHEADYVENERAEQMKVDSSCVGPIPEDDLEPLRMEAAGASPFDGPILKLYAAHFLGTFGDRMWQFAIPYLFTKLWDRDMTPQSVFCLLLYLSSFFGMIQVGKWIDCTQRLVAVRTTIVLEAMCIVLSVAFFWLLLENVYAVNGDEPDTVGIFDEWSVIFPFVCLLVTAVIAELMTKAGTIAVEKDWVVEIANGDSQLQTQLNSWMRRIDLTCKLGGPFVFVLIDTILQTVYEKSDRKQQFLFGAAVVAVWNILSCPLELHFINTVYEAYPRLQRLKDTGAILATNEAAASDNPISVLMSSVKQYLRHPIMLMSVSYCQLWFTVVDNGTLMTAFLLSQNVNSFALVAGRGTGAMFGIVGTFVFPHLLAFCDGSLRKAGAMSLYSFLAIVGAIGVCFLLLPMRTAGYVMLVTAVFSRAPLWSFDLAVQQLMQEGIDEGQRGVINGVHSSVCQLMLMFVYIAALALAHSYEDFPYLVYISVISVALSAFCYSRWLLK
eukprot:TRINITY_DN13660_c0_g1_i2.p1 TRINITY_DN13660_c0_g1~~TRINITY_DN13660_c0_g1_i2.p1  ORF type:complete len:510 (+),score=216.90 TRINITY_DN13660_c0_g1_i2:90-1619(+)